METNFETSTETEKLDAALAKAQGEIQAAAKDKTNPAFRSRYADLSAVWEACREALTRNGISITQWPTHGEDGRLHIVTRLACAGQWIRAHFSMPVPKQDPHGYGSAITYAKRYTLAAAVGVVADEDDDGNAAAHNEKPQRGKPAVISTAQGKELATLIAETGSDVEKFCGFFRVESIAEIQAADFDRAKRLLEKKKQEAA
jgi:hypothetical protein